jgi:DNA primase
MMQFLTETAVEKYGLSVEGKIRILKDMQAPLASIQDGVARSLYTKALAERIGVDETAVLEKVRSAAVQDFMQRKRQPSQAENASSGKREKSTVEGRGHRMESHIIAMMLQFPDILPEVERKGILDRFVNDSLQAIGRMVLHHSGRPVSEIIDSIQDEKLHTRAVGLAMKDNVWDYDGCLKLLQQFERSRNRQQDHLMDEIKSAENENDQALVLELLRKKQMQLTQDQ